MNWSDLKRIVEFKTFFVVVSLVILGIACLIIDYIIVENYPDATIAGTFSDLGLTFITSSTVSLVMEIFLRIDIVDFMTEKMLNVLPGDIKGNTGVSEFHRDRKSVDFKEHIAKSKDFLRIIGISANDILASANMPLIKKKLLDNPKFEIQILLLSPWSSTAEIRSSAKTYKTHNEGIVKTQAVILDICNLKENLKADDESASSRLSLRIYDDIPSLSMVVDSQSAIVAPFMVVEQGGSSPYYIAERTDAPNAIYQLYCEHFDSIWEKSIAVDGSTDFNALYQAQRIKDVARVNNNHETYSDWVLSLNNIHTSKG